MRPRETRKFKSNYSSKAGPSSSNSSRSNRDRSRSPYDREREYNSSPKNRKSGNGFKPRTKAKPKKDDGDDENGSKRSSKGGSGKNRGEFYSPSSFSEAWPTFFTQAALLLVTAAGLVLDKNPELDKLPVEVD